jgi:hypothetical protein
MPASLTTLLHFSVSSPMSEANPEGDRRKRVVAEFSDPPSQAGIGKPAIDLLAVRTGRAR